MAGLAAQDLRQWRFQSTLGLQVKVLSVIFRENPHLACSRVYPVVSVAKIIPLLDLRKDSATNSDHPQKLVDVVAWVPAKRIGAESAWSDVEHVARIHADASC